MAGPRLAPQLALGTAQWGMAYGIANRTGPPSGAEIGRLLAAAGRAGIAVVDTARAYGESEARIGAALARESGGSSFRVVTKIAPGATAQESAEAARRRAIDSLTASRRALGRERLDTVLLHRAADREQSGGAVWQVLRRERAAGRIGRIGLSAGTPSEAAEALGDPDVEVVQVASSLLDRRLSDATYFERAAERGIEVHLRSVFLQGVAFLDPVELPGHLAPLLADLGAIRTEARRLEVPAAALFLAYAWTLKPDLVVVGFERETQLARALAWWARAAELGDSAGRLAAGLSRPPARVLDPAKWPEPTA